MTIQSGISGTENNSSMTTIKHGMTGQESYNQKISQKNDLENLDIQIKDKAYIDKVIETQKTNYSKLTGIGSKIDILG